MGGGEGGGISCVKGLGVRNKNGLRDRERRNGLGKEKNRGRIIRKVCRYGVLEHSKEKTDYGKLEIYKEGD
jgi:hypothetical protein